VTGALALRGSSTPGSPGSAGPALPGRRSGPAGLRLAGLASRADLQGRTVRYVAGLFVALVLLQRFAVPGLPQVSALVPVVLGWTAWGVLRGLLEVERSRLLLWCAAAGTAALAVPMQVHLVRDPIISPTSWALLVAIWLPAALRLRERSRATYVRVLRSVVVTASALAGGCVAMMAVQLAGVPYRDYLASVVPAPLLLNDFVITYPVVYGSELYRANAWIGLEPSMVSLQMGIGLLAAVLVGSSLRTVLLLVTGLICATSGSGFAILAVGVVVLLLHRARGRLVRYLPAAVAALVLLFTLPWGQYLLERTSEFSDSRSSTSLRGLLPYEYLWPTWIADPMAVLVGRGPGSSQQLVNDSGILGLLVPTPIKLFFDYGLVAGVVLAALLLYSYAGGPSRAFAVSLLVSLWLLQPGTTTTIVVAPLFLLVTWWAPSGEPALETEADVHGRRRWRRS
jgi:hypothetical protein